MNSPPPGPPPADRAKSILAHDEFTVPADALGRTGSLVSDAGYMHDAAKMAFAARAKNFGHLTFPALFLHGDWDTVCETARGRLANPMRADCADLTEAQVLAGHMLMIEQPDAVNAAIEGWLA